MGAKSLSSVSAGAIPPSYKRVIDTAPYLSKSEEYDLSVRWRDHGDKRAADRIVRAHLRLAIGTVMISVCGLAVDRKSTRRTPVTNAHLVCRLLLEKKKNPSTEFNNTDHYKAHHRAALVYENQH